ncbi:hypothetical protein C2I18_03525 [Paenibacillus sp. PK3_47]|nr:hypothetical protein C2I18_03525 [Paenibacillus sp. PK3_47]
MPNNTTTINSSIADNPLKTRQDLAAALEQLTDPLWPLYSDGGARLTAGNTGAGYPASTAAMEGFSRVLWGLVPLLAGGGKTAHWDLILDGIRHGTDPSHEEYWGDVRDYDQRLVEMAVFGFALAAIPDKLWEPLVPQEQENLYNWLNQINAHPCHDCNWLFFNVLVNAGFSKIGRPYDKPQMERNLDRMDAFHLEDGWYSDGVGGHSDYYGPFAIHYYSLLYARLMEQEDPERSQLYKERAREFAPGFLAWFAPGGSALPYGRSMAYRFAQSAFWSAFAYAGLTTDTLTPGVVKGIVLRNLRWWFSQPIFDARGVLTIGYAYPSLVMAESYNAPGSPYWALKAFLPLALGDGHPFWQEDELPLPEIPAVMVQQAPHLVMVREEAAGHVAAFNSGHLSSNEHTHTSAKYEKFVYSTGFGFSVPRAEWGLSQGAFDSMLALSEGGDNLYRVRRRNAETAIEDNVLHAVWNPWRDVEVRSWIIAGLPWHIRLHRIAAGRPLDIAEGGFALGQEEELGRVLEAAGMAASTEWGTSAIKSLFGGWKGELVWPNANTNLLRPRTVLPTLTASLAPGVHWLASAVYGSPLSGSEPGPADLNAAAAAVLQQSPAELLNVTIREGNVSIITHTGKEKVILLD